MEPCLGWLAWSRRVSASSDPARQPQAAYVLFAGRLRRIDRPHGQVVRCLRRGGVVVLPDAEPRASGRGKICQNEVISGRSYPVFTFRYPLSGPADPIQRSS